MTTDVHHDTPLECELKLAGTRAELRKAETALNRIVGKRIEWSVDRLVTSYYDTSDRRLSKRSVALRVRKKGRTFTQTVKAKALSSATISQRPEWNVDVKSTRPDIDALPAAARKRVGLVLPNELRKLFTVDVERKKADIELAGKDGAEPTIVEIALDRGEVKTGRKSTDMTELEIELVSGDPAAIFDLALQLADTGLSINQVTKAETGYRLIDGAVDPLPVRLPKFKLDPSHSANDVIAEIFSAGLANVLDNEAATRLGKDPEGVHQMRVSLRRMRSALSVFRRLIDADQCQWAKDELKWLASSLGPARDWDVFGMDILDPVDGFGVDVDAINELRDGVKVKQQTAYDHAREVLSSPRYTRFLIGMSQFIATETWRPLDAKDNHPLERPIKNVSGAILGRALRRLMRAGRGLRKMSIEQRHDARIELKKFRYATDFLHSLYPQDRVRPFMKSLSRMQDQFGHLNDVAVAKDLLAELILEKGLTPAARRHRLYGAGQVVAWHARGVQDAEQDFLGDWRTLKRTTPFWDQNKGAS